MAPREREGPSATRRPTCEARREARGHEATFPAAHGDSRLLQLHQAVQAGPAALAAPPASAQGAEARGEVRRQTLVPSARSTWAGQRGSPTRCATPTDIRSARTRRKPSSPTNSAQTALGFQPSVLDQTHEVERRHKNVKEKIEEELKRMFRPEFLNHIDAVVVFKSLTTEQIRQIVDLQLGACRSTSPSKSIELEVAGAAMDLLAKEGYDRVFGARPLRAGDHEPDRRPALRAPAAGRDRAWRHRGCRRQSRGRLHAPRHAAPERDRLGRFPTFTGRAGLDRP